ncbi:hypothetical protein Pcinc_021621 [Petrolisthes cinctipes]|uniref:K Homology domain-containing protein n=1 Tax=Petrolisthes cinctipes TaxID=88211 RepID=A0AAE1KI30_PETCI|nr:hypothetical protein Pcinc_021621 [Petrolisthes cinctipes]
MIQGQQVEELGIVLPGDKIEHPDLESNWDSICVGPGLSCKNGAVNATRAGRLKMSSKNKKYIFYVDSHCKRYIPQAGEFVIGVITRRLGYNYLIDIGASGFVTITDLIFENYSKKNIQHLYLGDLIYGQLFATNNYREPEFVPLDIPKVSVGIAPLPRDGIMFHVPLHVARLLIDPSITLLETIGKKTDFTLVVGYNGRVWLHSEDINDVVTIMNNVMMLEIFSPQELRRKLSCS